jgi:hypothetical protein
MRPLIEGSTAMQVADCQELAFPGDRVALIDPCRFGLAAI